MTHRFQIASRTWPWKYVRLKGKADGWTFVAQPPGKASRHRILINNQLTGRKRLRIELHEFLHAAFPDIDEDVIDKRSSELTRILTTLGYKMK